MPQRLPQVNGDDGQWGTILNQFLEKEHYNDTTDNAINGGHKTITVRPGTAAAGSAPLKFSAGTVLTTPETGAVEFNNSRLYFTPASTRKTIAVYDDTAGATGDMYYRDASGNFVRLGLGSSGQVLKVIGSQPGWGAADSGGASTGVDNADGGHASSIFTSSPVLNGGSA